MTQPIDSIWTELTAEECTKRAITDARYTLDKFAEKLRPELADDPGKASSWIRDCLNPNRSARLTEDQHILTGNITGNHYWLMHYTAKAKHTMGWLVKPEIQQANLMHTLKQQLQMVQNTQAQIIDLQDHTQ